MKLRSRNHWAILVIGSLCLLFCTFAGSPGLSVAAETVYQRRDTVTFEAIALAKKPKVRMEIQGEFVSQERGLDGPFAVSESISSQSWGELLSTNQERKSITDLDERGQLQLYLVKVFYSLTDRIEIHGKIGTGKIVTKFENIRGLSVQTTEGFSELFPPSSSTTPFSDPNTYRGNGNLGFAAGAGIDIVLYQSSTPNFSLSLGGQWTYLESDDILKITDDAVIEESRTNLFDVGIKARFNLGSFSPYGGIKAIWLLTKYEGHFTKVEVSTDSLCPWISSTKTEKEGFSFKTEPKDFPIVGMLGIDYAFTDSAGMKIEGAVGNNKTYFLSAGFFYRF